MCSQNRVISLILFACMSQTKDSVEKGENERKREIERQYSSELELCVCGGVVLLFSLYTDFKWQRHYSITAPYSFTEYQKEYFPLQNNRNRMEWQYKTHFTWKWCSWLNSFLPYIENHLPSTNVLYFVLVVVV